MAYCKRGRGLIKVNGCPIELLEPAILRVKTFEPVLLLGPARFSNVDIRVRVRGGGYTSQVCTFSCFLQPSALYVLLVKAIAFWGLDRGYKHVFCVRDLLRASEDFSSPPSANAAVGFAGCPLTLLVVFSGMATFPRKCSTARTDGMVFFECGGADRIEGSDFAVVRADIMYLRAGVPQKFN